MFVVLALLVNSCQSYQQQLLTQYPDITLHILTYMDLFGSNRPIRIYFDLFTPRETYLDIIFGLFGSAYLTYLNLFEHIWNCSKPMTDPACFLRKYEYNSVPFLCSINSLLNYPSGEIYTTIVHLSITYEIVL